MTMGTGVERKTIKRGVKRRLSQITTSLLYVFKTKNILSQIKKMSKPNSLILVLEDEA